MDNLGNSAAAFPEGEGKLFFTIPQFCHLCQISTATFYKLQNEEHGPPVVYLGGNTARIPVEAARKWIEERLADTGAQAIRRAILSRRGHAAGRAAVQSPRHHCRRGQTAKEGSK